MRKIKTESDLINWIETMHLQNQNGRETNEDLYRLGIENTIEELIDLGVLEFPLKTNDPKIKARLKCEFDRWFYSCPLYNINRGCPNCEHFKLKAD